MKILLATNEALMILVKFSTLYGYYMVLSHVSVSTVAMAAQSAMHFWSKSFISQAMNHVMAAACVELSTGERCRLMSFSRGAQSNRIRRTLSSEVNNTGSDNKLAKAELKKEEKNNVRGSNENVLNVSSMTFYEKMSWIVCVAGAVAIVSLKVYSGDWDIGLGPRKKTEEELQEEARLEKERSDTIRYMLAGGSFERGDAFDGLSPEEIEKFATRMKEDMSIDTKDPFENMSPSEIDAYMKNSESGVPRAMGVDKG